MCCKLPPDKVVCFSQELGVWFPSTRKWVQYKQTHTTYFPHQLSTFLAAGICVHPRRGRQTCVCVCARVFFDNFTESQKRLLINFVHVCPICHTKWYPHFVELGMVATIESVIHSFVRPAKYAMLKIIKQRHVCALDGCGWRVATCRKSEIISLGLIFAESKIEEEKKQVNLVNVGQL